jgi:hypothetical protein
MTELNRARHYDKTGRPRQDLPRCWYDNAILDVRPGLTICPECGRTAQEMAQAPR